MKPNSIKDLKVGMRFENPNDKDIITIVSIDLDAGAVWYQYSNQMEGTVKSVAGYPEGWSRWELIYEVEGFEV